MIRGAHHCVGLAVSVSELMIRFMKSQISIYGGTLGPDELDKLHIQFVASIPKAGKYFEGVDHRYAEACGATTADPFSRSHILPTLINAVGDKAARTAFPQAEYIGANWILQLCGGIANYIRKQICPDADDRAITAYLSVGGRLGPKLGLADVLADSAIQRVLRDSLMPILKPETSEQHLEPLCDAINTTIAGQRGIGKADPAKVTDAELKKFLVYLPSQMLATFNAAKAS